MPALASKRLVFGVCHSGIVIGAAETVMFHVLNITVSIVTQPSSDALLVASVRTAMQTTDMCGMRLLLFPHLTDIFHKSGSLRRMAIERSPVKLLSAGTTQLLQHKCGG